MPPDRPQIERVSPRFGSTTASSASEELLQSRRQIESRDLMIQHLRTHYGQLMTANEELNVKMANVLRNMEALQEAAAGAGRCDSRY